MTGRMLACMSSMSEGDDLSPPVINSMAILWTLASCDVNPMAPLPPPFLPLPFEISPVHHTSAAYSIFGTITPSYNLFINFPWMPLVGRIIQVHTIAYFVPFARAWAACSLKLRFLSMMIPRNLWDFEG
jgi:hypothetical protein